MKKTVVLFVLLLFSSPAYADVLVPPNAWELLKQRPQVSRPTVFIPEPGPGDVVSADVASPDAGSDDGENGA